MTRKRLIRIPEAKTKFSPVKAALLPQSRKPVVGALRQCLSPKSGFSKASLSPPSRMGVSLRPDGARGLPTHRESSIP